MTIFVCYHYPCPDGIMGALAAYLHFKHKDLLSQVKWKPLTVFATLESRLDYARASFTKEDTVYLIDFSGGAAFLALASELAQKVVLIDHHKTAAEDLATPMFAEHRDTKYANLDSSFVNMEKSGATLAAEYFKMPEASALFTSSSSSSSSDSTMDKASQLTKLFAYIEDNDLWRHALPDSKLFTAGFSAQANTEWDVNKHPEIFDELLALQFEQVVQRGKEVIEEQDRIISAELETSFPISIPFHAPPSAGGAGGSSGGAEIAATVATTTTTSSSSVSSSQLYMTALTVITTHPDYRSVQGNRLATKSASTPNPLSSNSSSTSSADATAVSNVGIPSTETEEATEGSNSSSRKKACQCYDPVGVVVYEEEGMGADKAAIMYKVSLRSLGTFDTTPISKAYGGGGHKNASSFVIGKDVFNTWRV